MTPKNFDERPLKIDQRGIKIAVGSLFRDVIHPPSTHPCPGGKGRRVRVSATWLYMFVELYITS